MSMARHFAVIGSLLLVVTFVGCNQQQRTDQLRDRTADVTAAVKRDAKAMAEGVREGWTRDNPLNLNTADRDQLQKLPGIDAPRADRIIAHRPYRQTSDLLTRKILTKPEYDRISDRVKVK